MRTSNLTEREISGIKIITQGQTQLAQVKRAITQTIVAKKREEVRDDLRAGDSARPPWWRPGGYAEAPNFHLHGDSDDDQADTISESESNCSEPSASAAEWARVSRAADKALALFLPDKGPRSMEISTVYNCQDIGFECEPEKKQSRSNTMDTC